MRRVASAVILAIATLIGVFTPALAQGPPPPPGGRGPPPLVLRGGSTTITTALTGYAIGGFVCAVVSPMIGTVMLNRELTANEVGRSTLNCFLGPIGWVIGPALFPIEPVTLGLPPRKPPSPGAPQGQARGRNISVPPAGETRLVPNEVLLQVAAGASNDLIARRLQMTLLETQSFTLTGRTLQRWRIDGDRSVAATLRGMPQVAGIVAAQPNYLYLLQQDRPAAAAEPAGNQYVVSKLRLLDAHRISNGDNVLVAVIDSQIDASHPDLAGVIASEYDVTGAPAAAHSHGTAMAGAIAAHSKLIGVAPKVRLLAIRAFTGSGESAQSTSFNILKALEWAAANRARIINMSFAGPADAMTRDLLAKADARGIVLIAAVGNAGPTSPPLYPAADSHVIGVTATDAQDRLLALANRGPQVAVAAPGVEILAAAPNGGYQVTSGTSIAAAHASGLAALLIARKAGLTPADARRLLIRSANAIPGGKHNEVGAGVIDALGAVNLLRN